MKTDAQTFKILKAKRIIVIVTVKTNDYFSC